MSNRLLKHQLPSSLQSKQGWGNYFESKRSYYPHIHQIEPTNHCPYTCVMCPRTENMSRGTGFMNMNLYYKIIDEIISFDEKTKNKEIELFHFGESLIHPQLPEMISYASSKNLKITLSLNPPSLSQTKIEKIIEANPCKIILSIDSHDNKSYKEIRGDKADFDKALENIAALAFEHKKQNSFSLIIVRLISMSINKDSFELLRTSLSSFDNIQVESRDFFPWTEERLVDLGVVPKWSSFMPCKFPWDYLVIQWNGDVVGCCRDYNGHNNMGNVLDSSLLDIWNSERYASFRKEHIEGIFENNDFCKNCTKIYYSED